MTRARTWTCRKCREKHPRTRQKCPCGARRPAKRVPKHRRILDELPYEAWVERFGEQCGICGRPPSATRRLDRDHDHRSGKARGLLCARCNQALPNWMDVDWLRAAADYLTRRSTP